nr:serine carboxypeptidase-like 33 [Ziziphus jujuba var. spinosa]
MSHSQFSKGDQVEVVEDPGQSYASPYFLATVLHSSASNKSLIFVEYQSVLDTTESAPTPENVSGSPGCSSIGYGAAVELGPLRVSANGTGLQFNEFAWNTEANLLFVESPTGVGFSYSNTSSDFTKFEDTISSENAYIFLVNWLKRFPQFKTRDFFIAGESYAGHYVPQLAELVYDRNKDTTKYPLINLKGFIVGNPETDDYYDYKGLLEYAWSHAVISDQLYEKAKQVCDFKLSIWSEECNKAMSQVFEEYREIDIYNIYAPRCLIKNNNAKNDSNNTESLTKVMNSYGLRKMRIFGGYDPCYSTYAEEYFNRLDVQTSLHVNVDGRSQVKWKVCNDSISVAYNFTVSSVLPIYTKLKEGGLKIWIYSGDADGSVPVIGSRYCVEALHLPLKSPWRSWYHNQQVGGRILEYEGLTFVTVRGAGHLVPLNKPSESLSLIHSFLTGHHLPIHP